MQQQSNVKHMHGMPLLRLLSFVPARGHTARSARFFVLAQLSMLNMKSRLYLALVFV